MRILVIEDDLESANFIAQGFREEGYSVDLVSSGRDGLILASSTEYDVLVVDRMLPELDGLSLVTTLRKINNDVPVLFLTSLGGIDSRVEGLQAGGDDYVVKPFSFRELLARVEALSRRPAMRKEILTLEVSDLQMDLLTRRVRRGDEVIDLRQKEFKLLQVLMENKERVMTRTMLLDQVWGLHFEPKTSVVETHISRLRGKIDKPFGVNLICTIRGVGYSIREPQ